MALVGFIVLLAAYVKYTLRALILPAYNGKRARIILTVFLLLPYQRLPHLMLKAGVLELVRLLL